MSAALPAGLLLLAAGLLLLLVGDSFFASDAASRSLWTALIGVMILLGSMLYLLLRTPEATPAPVAHPQASEDRVPVGARAPAAVAVAVPEPVPAPAAPSTAVIPAAIAARTAAPSVRRAVAMAAEKPETGPSSSRSTFPTSIPGAYLQALSRHESGPDRWSEVAPPIAAALPFSPGIGRSSEIAAPWDESSEGSERDGPRLELELARLRARVRELEVPPRTIAPSILPPRSPGLPQPAKEPPSPPSAVASGPRGCAGCGTGITSHGPSHLCWGCGRTLCSTCYWRYGPGPGLHRCPDCLARAPTGTEAISGGRLTSSSGAVARPAAPPPALRR
ncbi:MAG: hypothetical protein L3K06_06860 [Thermoplasmata archaeon]|nr:hypothetical protein [Thermoplasmata archaeon]